MANKDVARSPYWPYYPLNMNYFTYLAHFHVAYRSTAIRNAIIMWISYLPILFIAVCVRREPKIKEHYKTTILFSAYAQFVLTLPQTLFHTWIGIAVSQEYETTVFWCSMLKLNSAALNFMSYNAILVRWFMSYCIAAPKKGVAARPTRFNLSILTLTASYASAMLSLQAVGFSRLVSLVFNVRVGIGSVLAAFTFYSSFLVALVAYMSAFNAAYANETCAPIIYFAQHIPSLLYNIYTFVIPFIALLFNLTTVIYLFYIKSKQQTVSNSKKVDELIVALSLLLQSAIPALTITAKAFFTLITIHRTYDGKVLIQPPAWLVIFADWAGLFTTGLNVVASIVFIKSFQDQFKAMFCIPVIHHLVRIETTTTTTTTSVAVVH